MLICTYTSALTHIHTSAFTLIYLYVCGFVCYSLSLSVSIPDEFTRSKYVRIVKKKIFKGNVIACEVANAVSGVRTCLHARYLSYNDKHSVGKQEY